MDVYVKRGSRGSRVSIRFRAALWLIVLAVAGSVGLAGVASAQFSALSDPPTRFEWRGRVAADYRAEFESKSDAGDEFDAWRSGVYASFGGPINESILVSFSGRYAHSSYDFNLDNGAPAEFGGTQLPREPWNTLNTLDLLPSATILVGSEVSVVASVPIRWAAENGADRNGFAAGISALVRWQVNDSLSVGAGIGVMSQLEDDAETFPIVSFRWRIDESFEFRTEGSWYQGGNATLLWGASDAFRLTFSVGYERTRFRLDEYGTAADTNGIGEVTTIPLEVGIRFRIIDAAYLDVRTGLGIAGRIRVEADNGNKLYDQQYDTAPRVGVAIIFPFGLPAP